LILGLAFLFTFPLYLSAELLTLMNLIGISIIVALGIHILTGCCGIINFGQAGFMCVGAYMMSILSAKLGWSFWMALPCAVLMAGMIGLLFGLISLKVKGLYLMVITLAAGIIIPMAIQVVILPAVGVSVAGMYGVYPSVGGRVFNTPEEVFFIIMAFMVLATFCAINLGRSRMVRTLKSLKDNDLASEVGGVDVSWYKLLAFFTCCLFAGLGGSLWVMYMPMLSLGQFSYAQSIWYLGMIIVGGMGSVSGVFMGAMVIRGIDFLITSRLVPWASGQVYLLPYLPPWLIGHLTGVSPLLLSVFILLFLIFAPQGIVYWWNRFKGFYRVWPLAY
jgi:branched-chain amino acid transport system permease protein